MWIVPALTALFTTAVPSATPSPQLDARVAALAAADDVACYEPAAGRASVPVRENYCTFSPVVGSVKRGQVFLGHRVEGENKVLVLTPHAAGPVGIARFTFTREVDKARCAGEKLYAPEFEDLQAWTQPLEGESEAPRPPGQLYSALGCFTAPKDLRTQPRGKDGQGVELPRGQHFFAGFQDEGCKYSSKLVVLDAGGGAELGTVMLNRVQRVGFAECGGAAALVTQP